MIPIGLTLISAGLPRLSRYSVEESLVLLLGFAILLVVILLAVITVRLLWQGANAIVLWLKVSCRLRVDATNV
jgi:hypothetical protein